MHHLNQKEVPCGHHIQVPSERIHTRASEQSSAVAKPAHRSWSNRCTPLQRSILLHSYNPLCAHNNKNLSLQFRSILKSHFNQHTSIYICDYLDITIVF